MEQECINCPRNKDCEGTNDASYACGLREEIYG
jgi:hypothetical protein